MDFRLQRTLHYGGQAPVEPTVVSAVLIVVECGARGFQRGRVTFPDQITPTMAAIVSTVMNIGFDVVARRSQFIMKVSNSINFLLKNYPGIFLLFSVFDKSRYCAFCSGTNPYHVELLYISS